VGRLSATGKSTAPIALFPRHFFLTEAFFEQDGERTCNVALIGFPRHF
jgi:hypothetical protein